MYTFVCDCFVVAKNQRIYNIISIRIKIYKLKIKNRNIRLEKKRKEGKEERWEEERRWILTNGVVSSVAIHNIARYCSCLLS